MRDTLDALAQRARSLEPDARERQRLQAAVTATAERFLDSLETRNAFEEPGDGSGLEKAPIADEGTSLDAVLEMLERDVLHPGGQPASAGHLAYLSGGGLYHAALADYLAAVTNKYAGLAFTGPGPVRMENRLLRWVADLLGYPATAGGSILSGGSLAHLTAMTAALDAHGLRAADFASTVVYLSGQTHHSLQKALRIAGLGEVQVRTVPLDEHHRMRPESLAEAIAVDRADGLKPWLVVGTAGSTDTGAVDPLDRLAAVAEAEGCWFHVDAAYGGFFRLTEQGHRSLAGIERSHSAILDPHKGLFLPWGAGIVMVRDVRTLLATHQMTGHYLQDALPDPEAISPADVSPELTRPFRALRLWLPLVHLGVAPFRAALEEKLLLARFFHREVRTLGFEVGPEPDLSIVTFRWAPDGVRPEEADVLNQAILDGVRRDGRIFLSSTRLEGRFTLRMAALAHRTHRPTLDLALEILGEQVERARRARQGARDRRGRASG